MLITGYHSRTIHADSGTARIEVKYDIAGIVDVDTSAHYRRQQHTATVTFTLMLTDTGWQIAAPVVEPHVLANHISPRTTFSAVDWALVRQDARRVTPSGKTPSK